MNRYSNHGDHSSHCVSGGNNGEAGTIDNGNGIERFGLRFTVSVSVWVSLPLKPLCVASP